MPRTFVAKFLAAFGIGTVLLLPVALLLSSRIELPREKPKLAADHVTFDAPRPAERQAKKVETAPLVATSGGLPSHVEADYFWLEAGTTDEADLRCQQVQTVAAPSADRPSKADRKRLRGCSSTNLYYGVDGRRNFADARKCAFIEWEKQRDEDPIMYVGPSGPGVLMMIYANGQGVKRNLPFATRMACIAGHSIMDVRDRVQELRTMETDKGKRIDFCGNYSSGRVGGACAAAEGERRDASRQARIDQLTRGWPADLMKAWRMVGARRGDFEEARIDGEIDLSGTLRGAFAVEQEISIRDLEATLLADLVNGRLRADSTASLRGEDRQMKLVYAQLMAEGPDAWPERAEIKATQKAWLLYRDAWARFARHGWPDRADAVVAVLTRERTRQLACLLRIPPAGARCSTVEDNPLPNPATGL